MDRQAMTPDRRTEVADHFMHAGAGTGLVVANVGAIIPGFIPTLALTAVVAVAAVLPFLVLGLAAAIAVGPPYATWRFIGWGRRRRRQRRQDQLPAAPPQPAPYTGIC